MVVNSAHHLLDKVGEVILLTILSLNPRLFLSLKNVRDSNHEVFVVSLIQAVYDELIQLIGILLRCNPSCGRLAEHCILLSDAKHSLLLIQLVLNESFPEVMSEGHLPCESTSSIVQVEPSGSGS